MPSDLPPGLPPSASPPPMAMPYYTGSGQAPMPALPVGYAMPDVNRRRPGAVTAIGIISVVLGSLGLLSNTASVFSTFVMSQMSAQVAAIQNRQAFAQSAASGTAGGGGGGGGATVTASGEYVATDGFSAAQREIVVGGLSRVRNLSDVRRAQVDSLLADSGKKVFKVPPSALTEQMVAANVSDANTEPDASGGPPADVFVLGEGRLVVRDDTAVFFPAGSPTPIRSGGGSATDDAGRPVLSDAQAQAVVGRVAAMIGAAFNPDQQDALTQELSRPGQTWIKPSPSVTAAVAQVRSGRPLPDGTAVVTTNGGTLTISPEGVVNGGTATGGPAGSGPNVTTINVQARNAMAAQFGLPRGAMAVLLIDASVGLLIAVYLLTIGIMVLRDSPRGRALHYVYVVVKFLALLLGIVMAVWFWSAGGPFAHAMAWSPIFGTVLGLVYPLILLGLLSMQTVKAYYATFGG